MALSMQSTTLIPMMLSCDSLHQDSSALRRDVLLLEIQTALHSPRKIFERALIARSVKVEALGWNVGLERLDSDSVRFFASTARMRAMANREYYR